MIQEIINCVIIEDEEPNKRLLENYIEQIDSLKLIGSFNSPIEFVSSGNLTNVQILYLDIQMPEMTGIEFLRAIPTDAEVIFTTAYPDFALQGYELNVTDYLLKPIEFDRFLRATNKAMSNIKLKKDATNIIEEQEYIFFKADKRLIRMAIKDIVYIKADWNYVHVVTKKSKVMVLSTMKSIEDDLSNSNFVRIHKSFIINLDYFEFIEGNRVSVNGEYLQVSRGYKVDLMKALNG